MKEIKISELIEQLQALKDAGNTSVQINGTLMCERDGNTIIATTKPQW